MANAGHDRDHSHNPGRSRFWESLDRGPWTLAFLASAWLFILPVSVNVVAESAPRQSFVSLPPASAVRIILKWASHYGVDEDLAVRIAVAESGLDCEAQSNESSAGGLFQFVDSTFLETQRQLNKPADIAKKFDCEENAQLGAYLLSKGKYQHWNASRPIWHQDRFTHRESESSLSSGITN